MRYIVQMEEQICHLPDLYKSIEQYIKTGEESRGITFTETIDKKKYGIGTRILIVRKFGSDNGSISNKNRVFFYG